MYGAFHVAKVEGAYWDTDWLAKTWSQESSNSNIKCNTKDGKLKDKDNVVSYITLSM
jgi:hypothetical protein